MLPEPYVSLTALLRKVNPLAYHYVVRDEDPTKSNRLHQKYKKKCYSGGKSKILTRAVKAGTFAPGVTIGLLRSIFNIVIPTERRDLTDPNYSP